MKKNILLIVSSFFLFFSCKKENVLNPGMSNNTIVLPSNRLVVDDAVSRAISGYFDLRITSELEVTKKSVSITADIFSDLNGYNAFKRDVAITRAVAEKTNLKFTNINQTIEITEQQNGAEINTLELTVERTYSADLNQRDQSGNVINTGSFETYKITLIKKNNEWKILTVKNIDWDIMKQNAEKQAAEYYSVPYRPNNFQNEGETKAITSLNATSITNYCTQWALSRNPVYQDFGMSDCTNFISQCLKAGGWSNTPTSLGGATSTMAWYSRSKFNISNSWCNASYFFEYMKNTPSRAQPILGRDLSVPGGINYFTAGQYTSNFNGLPPNVTLKVGDILSVNFNPNTTSFVGHSVIVSAKDANGTIYVSTHSYDRKHKALALYIGESANNPAYVNSRWYPFSLN